MLWIGLLTGSPASDTAIASAAFRNGLTETGYLDGQNIPDRVPVG